MIQGRTNTRPGCWEIPSARIAELYWTRWIQPTTWRALWAALVATHGRGR